MVPARNRHQIDTNVANRGKVAIEHSGPLQALTSLVTLVFLITCTNVGSLPMVRKADAVEQLFEAGIRAQAIHFRHDPEHDEPRVAILVSLL